MNHPKYPKSYIEMAKQFSIDAKQHQQKQHQKKQLGRYNEMSEGAKAWKEAPLDKEQVDELFWKLLVQYGWKQKTDKYRIDLVLPCPACDSIIVTYPLITGSEANRISQPTYASQQFDSHVCKPEA
jgi:hypothetical protein